MVKYLKDNLAQLSLTMGILASIIGASVAFGKNTQEIKNVKKEVGEVRLEVKEKRETDLQQTVLIQRISVQLQSNVRLIEKIEKKLDK